MRKNLKSNDNNIIGHIRSSLNKLTPKNHSLIMDQLKQVLYENSNDNSNDNEIQIGEISSLVLLKMTIDVTNDYRDVIKIISQHYSDFLPVFTKTSHEFINSLNEDTNLSKYPRYFAFFKLLPSFNTIYSSEDITQFVNYAMDLLNNPTMSNVAIEILCNYISNSFGHSNHTTKKIIDKLSDLTHLSNNSLPSRLRFLIHDSIKT